MSSPRRKATKNELASFMDCSPEALNGSKDQPSRQVSVLQDLEYNIFHLCRNTRNLASSLMLKYPEKSSVAESGKVGGLAKENTKPSPLKGIHAARQALVQAHNDLEAIHQYMASKGLIPSSVEETDDNASFDDSDTDPEEALWRDEPMVAFHRMVYPEVFGTDLVWVGEPVGKVDDSDLSKCPSSKHPREEDAEELRKKSRLEG